MAIRFDGTSNYLSRTTSLPSFNSPYTIMGHFYLATDRNLNSVLFFESSDGLLDLDLLWTTTDGTTLQALVRKVAASDVTVNGTSLSLATWYHIAMVRE